MERLLFPLRVLVLGAPTQLCRQGRYAAMQVRRRICVSRHSLGVPDQSSSPEMDAQNLGTGRTCGYRNSRLYPSHCRMAPAGAFQALSDLCRDASIVKHPSFGTRGWNNYIGRDCRPLLEGLRDLSHQTSDINEIRLHYSEARKNAVKKKQGVILDFRLDTFQP